MKLKTQAPITGGIYLVLDPAVEQKILLEKLSHALAGGVQIIQIWNNWPAGLNKTALISAIAKLCKPKQIPLLVNEEWELLVEIPDLDGIHFDAVPADLPAIRKAINRSILTGITCSGNLDTVRWANINQLDYVSFCAMFPSPSAGNCDIVMPETVRQARKLTPLPFFISGGLTPENTAALRAQIPFDGIAVISGILSTDFPEEKVKQYHQALTINKHIQ